MDSSLSTRLSTLARETVGFRSAIGIAILLIAGPTLVVSSGVLMIGETLGPYQILAKLGTGGMGEVYRGRDTRLNRDVAIKVLPGLFANDPDRLARFMREAQTLAALNHPNIAQIYRVEESGSLRAIVMELAEGEDLSARLTRGALPVAEALFARSTDGADACRFECRRQRASLGSKRDGPLLRGIGRHPQSARGRFSAHLADAVDSGTHRSLS
jgi:Protein kinase domain